MLDRVRQWYTAPGGAMLRLVLPAVLALLIAVSGAGAEESAKEAVSLDITVRNAKGSKQSKLRDKSNKSREKYKKSEVLTVTSKEPMSGIYIRWGSTVAPYTLKYNDHSEKHGEQGFLHDYVALAEPATSVEIVIGKDVYVSEIEAFSEGKLPADVQVWEPSLKEADILVLSTHADDEILFMGGVLAQYGGQEKRKVQVAYMCEFWSTEPVREHEKLDGLWASGIRNYPVCMGYYDYYSKTLDKAKTQYDIKKLTKSVCEVVRRFKPLVIVTHDIKGEYGHGGHMILNAAVQEAIEHTMDADYQPESAEKYGTWDVPKTYFHLYGENKLRLNMRVPLSEFGGKTALEVAKEAYKKHESQQWCWFYVSDDYEYSAADFGLFRTTVGLDTGNDMMEHVSRSKQTNTVTPTPTVTEELKATVTPTPTVMEEPKATETPTPTVTEKPKATVTPTPTVTEKPKATETPTPTVTEAPMPTETTAPNGTPTPTATEASTPTETPALTGTPTPAVTAAPTPTETTTPALTEEPKTTDTPTPTEEPKSTDTPTPVASVTPAAETAADGAGEDSANGRSSSSWLYAIPIGVVAVFAAAVLGYLTATAKARKKAGKNKGHRSKQE